MPRIVYIPFGEFDRQFARELAPNGFELVEVSAGSSELRDAMPEADYLIGLGDRSSGAHHLDVGLDGERVGQRARQQLVIVDQQNANGLGVGGQA